MPVPKISVIMAAYNSGKFIGEAILGILNQTFKDFELIIIDDCSTDNVPEIIKKYQATDPRIITLRNESNSGLTPTWNRGIKLAKADYIAMMDSDDVAYPERLKLEYEFLENNPEIPLVGCGAEIMDQNGRVLKKRIGYTDSDEIKFRMLLRNPFVHTTLMYRKQIFYEFGGYNKDYENSEDYKLFSSMANKYKLASIPQVLIKYRYNPNSITTLSKSREAQIKHSYRINTENINRYIKFGPADVKTLVDTVNKRPVSFINIIRSLFKYRKLTDEYIRRENLSAEQTKKIMNIYRTDKEMAVGAYLKRKVPLIYKIIKAIK